MKAVSYSLKATPGRPRAIVLTPDQGKRLADGCRLLLEIPHFDVRHDLQPMFVLQAPLAEVFAYALGEFFIGREDVGVELGRVEVAQYDELQFLAGGEELVLGIDLVVAEGQEQHGEAGRAASDREPGSETSQEQRPVGLVS